VQKFKLCFKGFDFSLIIVFCGWLTAALFLLHLSSFHSSISLFFILCSELHLASLVFTFKFWSSTSTTVGFQLWSQLCLWDFGFTPLFRFCLVFRFVFIVFCYLVPPFLTCNTQKQNNKSERSLLWSIYLTG